MHTGVVIELGMEGCSQLVALTGCYDATINLGKHPDIITQHPADIWCTNSVYSASAAFSTHSR